MVNNVIRPIITEDHLKQFCISNHIRKLSIFGSALRGEMNAESDIDLLVEFDAGKTPGLLEVAAMEISLSDIFGRKVDLRTPEDLSRYFRDTVLHEASVQYEQK